MPNKEQLEAIGPEAAKDSLRAQREARGLDSHQGQTTPDVAVGLDSVARCDGSATGDIRSATTDGQRYRDNRGQTIANHGRTAVHRRTDGQTAYARRRTDSGRRSTTNNVRTAAHGRTADIDSGRTMACVLRTTC